MGYFDDEENVEAYVEMVYGHDGRDLVEALRRHVPDGSRVLELGMGPGKDLALLAQHFRATGSDASAIFVGYVQERDPAADVLELDAVTLDTDRRFDAIFSNKVLQHLTKEDAARSLGSQWRVLNPGGIALHGLWSGDGLEEHHGLRFQQYTVESFAALLHDKFELLASELYEELAPDDSLCVVIRRFE